MSAELVFVDTNVLVCARVSALGAPLGSDFRVNTFTTGTQLIPAAAVAPSGDFVVAWESDGQDRPRRIRAALRRYGSGRPASRRRQRVLELGEGAGVLPTWRKHAARGHPARPLIHCRSCFIVTLPFNKRLPTAWVHGEQGREVPRREWTWAPT